jgi:hypothetical protein
LSSLFSKSNCNTKFRWREMAAQNYVTHDYHGWGSHSACFRHRGNGLEGSKTHSLICRVAIFDDGNRAIGTALAGR